MCPGTFDIDEGFRSVQGIVPILEKMGLEKASREEYAQWIADETQNRLTGKIS